MNTTPDSIERDQEDFHQRLLADNFLSEVPVLLQRKGVTDSDIAEALATLNERAPGKLGAVIVVLMPALTPESTDNPNPNYNVTLTVQVIENPLLNGDANGGIGLSCEQIARRVRQLFQLFAPGNGKTWWLSDMAPAEVAEGSISYAVTFSRKGGDNMPGKLELPRCRINKQGEVTIEQAAVELLSKIYYTTDGTYPSSQNPSAKPYADPFIPDAAVTLIRAVAEPAGTPKLPSNVFDFPLPQL